MGLALLSRFTVSVGWLVQPFVSSGRRGSGRVCCPRSAAARVTGELAAIATIRRERDTVGGCLL
jgi:hypothetical protein